MTYEEARFDRYLGYTAKVPALYSQTYRDWVWRFFDSPFVKLPDREAAGAQFREALLAKHPVESARVACEAANHPIEILRVPSQLLRRCVEYVLPFIRRRFKNPALIFCPVLYWIEHGFLCSKLEAATAASRLLPPHFQPLIRSDLASYKGEHTEEIDSDLVEELERYTTEVFYSADSDLR